MALSGKQKADAEAARKAKRDKAQAEQKKIEKALKEKAEYQIPGVVYEGEQGSFSQLLYATLMVIGGWDKNAIIIEKLPLDIYGRLSEIAQGFEEDNKFTKELLTDFFKQIVGEGEGAGEAATGGDDGVSIGEGGSGFLGDGKGITIKGQKASPDQIKNIEISMSVAGKLKASPLATKAMLCAGIGESEFKAIMNQGGSPYGGVFQGNVRGGVWELNDTAGMAKCFLLGGKGFQGGGAIKLAKSGMSPGEIALTVEGSGSNFGSKAEGIKHYGQHAGEADKIMAKYGTTGKAGAAAKGLGVTADTTTDEEDPEDTVKAGSAGSKKEPKVDPEKATKQAEKLLKKIDLKGAKEGFTPIANYAASLGLYVSSGSGGTHAAGSEHYSGAALDIALAGVQHTEAKKDKLAALLTGPMLKATNQVIYGHSNWRDGKKSPWTADDHLNHVHVSLKGKYLTDPKATAELLVAALNGEEISLDDDAAAEEGGVAGVASGLPAGGMALSASLNLPGTGDRIAAGLLTDEKALMNDVTLMPFIQQLCEASMRSFQSLPDGKFYAFYPDYFGEFYHRPAYWQIPNIEILDGKINLSDRYLVTHQYVVGSLGPTEMIGATEDWMRQLQTAGVVTIYNAFLTDEMLDRTSDREEAEKKDKKSKTNKGTGAVKPNKNGTYDKKAQEEASSAPFGKGIMQDKLQAGKFLQRYGARVEVTDNAFVYNRYFELFMAYQKFMLAWSRQFVTPFTFTFMPELYPGGKVAFPDHGIQMYIEEVTHEFDYEGGFTTSANLSAPSVITQPNSKGEEVQSNPALPPNMAKALVDSVATEDKPQSDNL